MLLLVAVLLPTIVVGSYVAARRLYATFQSRRPPLPDPPIQRIHADLRRLHDMLDETENSADLPAKNLRCRATRAAYVDALSVACRQLEVRLPTGQPVPRAEIYRVEAELRLRGVDVRPTG